MLMLRTSKLYLSTGSQLLSTADYEQLSVPVLPLNTTVNGSKTLGGAEV